jgi:hypothetical protein
MILPFRPALLRPLLFVWLLIWGAFSALPASAQAGASSDVLAAVKVALRSGSAKDVAHFFGPTIDLGIDGNKQNYSQTQAEFVVRDFFAKNPPTAFEFVHQGASDSGTPYAIGRYSTKAASYRVFIKLKNQKTGLLIDNLDFTKE